MSLSHVMSQKDFEHLYRLQVEELADYALFLIDVDGRILSWNAGVEAILQFSREDFVGKPVAEIFTPEDRAAGVPNKELQTAAEQGRAADVRWHLRKDGSRIFADGTMNAVRDEEGTLMGFSKIIRDATHRHRIDLALRESEAFARSIVESSPDCVKVLDLDGRIQLMNETGCRAMEIDDFAQYRNHPWVDFWSGPDREAAERALQTALNGRKATFEAYATSTKGNPKWWEVIVSPMLDAGGRPTRLLSISRDITERRQTQTLMQHSRDDLAEFAHVASHDLQAPLRTVRSYAQLLAKRFQGQLDEDADTFLAFILEGAQNMDDLIRGLLNYAEFGEKEERQRVAIPDIIAKVLATLKSLVDESGAKIVCGELPAIEANPTSIQQVFQNLISNALKYRSSAEPRIYIDAARKDGYWVFSVKDNGVGIASEFYDRVFLPFKRLHGHEIGGTGLGLAVCKRIVERDRGRIWVESKPGEGSTFFFTVHLS